MVKNELSRMNCHAWIVMQNINVHYQCPSSKKHSQKYTSKIYVKNIRQKYTSVLPRAALVVQSGALM